MRSAPSSGSWPATAATWCGRTPTSAIQIHAELDARFPGPSVAGGVPFDHEPALVIAQHLGSAQEIRARGLDGLAALLAPAICAPSAAAWRRSWPGPIEPTRDRNARRLTKKSLRIWIIGVALGC